jgi:hypothetical protein
MLTMTGPGECLFRDMKTGKVVRTSVQVGNDASTPPEDLWPTTYNLPPQGPATVRVTTFGSLCTGSVESTVD